MIDFRPAAVEDLSDIHKVWWAADPFDAFSFNPWFGHVLRTGSMMVAMAEGRLIGFAGVRRVGQTTVLSDCFVAPEHQARGVGRGLLSRLLPSEGPVMTLASQDPKARALYSRFGMIPQWDCHYVEGHPARVQNGRVLVSEVGTYPVDDSDLPHLRDDLRCRFVESGAGNAAVAADEIQSSILQATGDPVQELPALLGWMAGTGLEVAKLQISERHPLFPHLMESGFTVTDTDTLMAGWGAAVPDPTRITFNGDILRLSG